MVNTEVRIIGREYDGAIDEMESFAKKLVNIVKHAGAKHHGEDAVLTPTDIEVTPLVIENDHVFIVRAWHELAASQGRVGVLQPFEASFDLVLDKENGYFHHRIVEGANYNLTTVEFLALQGIVHLAAFHDAINSPLAQETP